MREVIRLGNVVRLNADGHRALGGVSLCVHKGERVRILGAPGSGKTALARVIAGTERPHSGGVHVMGEPVYDMTEDKAAVFRNRHIGYIPRVPAFWDGLTVLDNVTMPLSIRGVSASRRAKAGKEHLGTLGLLYAAHASPMRLLPYELRLAAIARALVTQPEILLLDEILAGLNAKEASKLADTLQVLWKFGGYTLLSLTADAGDAIQADRTITLDHGKNQEEKL